MDDSKPSRLLQPHLVCLISSSSSILLTSNSADVSLLLQFGDYSLTHQEDAACYSQDNCILTIPFMGKLTSSTMSYQAGPEHVLRALEGSGITIYVYQSGPVGINASFAVDGSLAQIAVLLAPPAPNYAIPNVSMFDVQQLRSGPHTASLTVNDLFGSFSGMIWDYAHVNETLVTDPTPQMTPSMAITSLSDPPSSTLLTSSPAPTTAPAPSVTSQYVYYPFTRLPYPYPPSQLGHMAHYWWCLRRYWRRYLGRRRHRSFSPTEEAPKNIRSHRRA